MNFKELNEKTSLELTDELGVTVTGKKRVDKIVTLLLSDSFDAIGKEGDDERTALSSIARSLSEIAKEIGYEDVKPTPPSLQDFTKQVIELKTNKELNNLTEEEYKLFLKTIIHTGLTIIKGNDEEDMILEIAGEMGGEALPAKN